MQAIIKFKLPEDEELFEIHYHAQRRFWDMYELFYELRPMVKHGIYNKSREELAEYIYDKLWEYVS